MSVESECPNCGAQYPEHPHMDWCRGDERTFAKPPQPVSEWKGVCEKCGRTAPSERLVVHEKSCGEAREWYLKFAESGLFYNMSGPGDGIIHVLEATPLLRAAEQMLEYLIALKAVIKSDELDALIKKAEGK